MRIYIFVALAAIFSAIADKLENENFYTSLFRKLNERFWYKRISWKYAKKLFGYKFDGWHISKSIMICCLFAAFAENFWQFVFLGIVWNFVFNLLYTKLLTKKVF